MDAIVVGTDGSEGGMSAVVKAGRLAAATGGRVVVVSAYGNPAGAAVMAPEAAAMAGVEHGEDRAVAALERAAACLEAEGVPHETRAVASAPAEALCEIAKLEQASTIVVGSRGMRGARRLLGSVPNAVTHRSPCDVLVVRTD